MKKIRIITGSTMGTAESVAEYLADKMCLLGVTTQLNHGIINLKQLPSLSGIWLIISSSHGAGEVPENLQPFVEQIIVSKVDLSKIQFGAIGLGSSEYDLFCGAIKTLDLTLSKHGAKRIGDVLTIDVSQHEIPENPAEKWLNNWLALL